MSMVQSPYRSAHQSTSSNQAGSQQPNSIYPSLPTHLGQSQNQGQGQIQNQNQPQNNGQMQRYAQPGPQNNQQQIQQSTSFGPISQNQQPPQYGQVQSYNQGQGQSSYNSTNAFSNSFAFGPQALSQAPSGKTEEEVRLGELGLAGERVGRGMRADEEISGDIADMMANAQAASESHLALEIWIDGQIYLPMRIYRVNHLPTTLFKSHRHYRYLMNYIQK